MSQVRLDKYLADAGVGTRREVKREVQKGKVQVNGTVAKDPGQKIDPLLDVVKYGEEVLRVSEFEYYLLHKPSGCVSATEDSRQKTVMEYVPSSRRDLFPVGRLDKDTEGLLLITNDGKLAHGLLSPARHVEKTYYAEVRGRMTQEEVQKFQEGLDIGEKKLTLPAVLNILDVCAGDDQEISRVEITIREGKFHQIKRMVQAVGKEVVYLRRISMGPLRLDENLKRGECRPLRKEEIEKLLQNRR